MKHSFWQGQPIVDAVGIQTTETVLYSYQVDKYLPTLRVAPDGSLSIRSGDTWVPMITPAPAPTVKPPIFLEIDPGTPDLPPVDPPTELEP